MGVSDKESEKFNQQMDKESIVKQANAKLHCSISSRSWIKAE
jgi:hypothetical protein